MAEYMFEILRTRTVILDEQIEVKVKVPASVPEDERESWVQAQCADDKLTFPDKDWTVADETESSVVYETVTQF